MDGIIGFFNTLLIPIRWVIEAILVGFHWFWTNVVQLDPDAGLTWVLSIVGLVLVVRAALIPIFVRQIKSQRRMLEVAPQLKKIQDKYKGKKDQFSREAMSRETMALYKKTGTNPLSSCLPLLLQMPIFFGLFTVLSNAQNPNIKEGVGLLNEDLSKSFGQSSLFDIAPLHLAISTANGNTAVIVIAVVMVIVRHVSQLAVRRSSGDAASARSFASVTGAVVWGALIMVVALALTLAQAYGVVNDPDSGRRITMAIIGASLAASGNALPRMLPPVSFLQDNAARVQAFQRLSGWTWVLGGLGFATAWLALPIDAAGPVSVAVVAAAFVVTIVQLLRLRKPRGTTLPA